MAFQKSRFLKLLKVNEVNFGILKNISQDPFNYVNGLRVTPTHSKYEIDVTNPATGEALSRMAVSSSADVDVAVRSSKEAYKLWSSFCPRERGKYLLAAARKIRENINDIVNLEVQDTGKPIWEARADIAACSDSIEYFGGIASTLKGLSRYMMSSDIKVFGNTAVLIIENACDHIPLTGGSFGMIVREPYGVCGGIGAWNYPFQVAVWKASPALAAGNTMVFKPSQFSPLTAVTLAEILTSVGVPSGVFNVVQGESETGKAICEHPDISKISFTGSVETGKKILQSSLDTIKKVTLELGGKSPLIVFDDCNLKNAVKGALLGNFLTQGQVCSNCTRIYVQKNILETFLSELIRVTEKLKIGSPWDEDTKIGATINPNQANKIFNYIKLAKEEGAEIVFGGKRILLPKPYSSGYYISPCIISKCTDDMRIVKEEIFGAVVCILSFESEEEVIERANNTTFGLAGGVFTNDLFRGHRVSRSIQAGTVWINNYNVYPPELPCGGYKMSGFGKECGEAALMEYTQQKTIMVEGGDVDCPLYVD
ncbi:Aldehyde dehydrogenase family 9 member A1-A [Nymphon striatum]|nr:Aldehyde dehydrogenase family 9 member A1-A [Nymphon striatum]